MATLDKLQARVRELTGIHSKGILTDSEITSFLNEAMMAVLASRDWPFLVEQVSAVVDDGEQSAVFAPSSTAHRIVDVYVQAGSGKAVEMFERAQPLIPEPYEGVPREFSWNAASSTMSLYPAADREYLITARVVIEPEAMVVENDGTPIPDRFEACVPFLAAARILEREGDEGKRALQFERRAWELVGDMVRVLLTSSRKTVVLGGRRSSRRSVRRQVW